MRGLRLWTLLAVFSLVAVKGLGQDLNLSDALDDDLVPTPTPKTKPKEPAGGPGASKDLDLADMLDDEPTPKPPVLPKDPVKPKPKPEETRSELFAATVRPGLLPRTTAHPLRTSAPPRKTPAGPDDFDLSDALEPNDIDGKGKDSGKGDKGMGGGGRGDSRPSTHDGNGNVFTDDDLLGVGEDDSYKPDKGKGGRGGAGDDLGPADDGDYDTMAETGTIAGIVSAVAMALVGAVSGYISYQKKKLCFSIQQSLNADVVKAENPEAVVAQEPQVQQTLLQPPNAEPPTDDNAV